MQIQKVEKNGGVCGLVESDSLVITDAQSALDLLMTVQYEVGSKNIVIGKELIAPEFFVLSTGLAGEILQKYVNYGAKLGIWGDFSGYTSKSLQDFIYEINKGKQVCFVGSAEEAVDRLVS